MALFNFRRKELADIRVRRAIAHALDIPFFIENFLGDFAKRGTGPIPSVSTDFYPADNGPQYPFDLGDRRQQPLTVAAWHLIEQRGGG